MDNALNHEAQNGVIQETIINIINNSFPIKSKNKQLDLIELRLEDKLENNDFPNQKEAKLSRKSWQVPILASFKLTDTDTGKVVDKRENIRIGYIPKLTNRFTVILDGNEYQTTNQIRRKPGIYARVKANGELENEFNLFPGYNFKMQLDPISHIFYVIFDNRKHRLWTLLNTLGVTDDKITEAWGAKLVEINKKGALNTEVSEMTNIYKKLYKKVPKDHNEVIEGLQKYFGSYAKVDPEVTEITLGERKEHVNGDLLLKSSVKLLDIEKGKAEPDDRDSLLFKQIYSVDDLLVAHFEKQNEVITKKLARNIDLKDKVREIISSTTFGKPVKGFFTDSDLSATPPQTNPVTILGDWRKTSPMGTGGIGSMHAVTMETRNVHPTHLGFLDSLATPESGKVGITLGLSLDTLKQGRNIKTLVINKEGNKTYITPKTFYFSKVGFPDQYELVNGKVKAKAAKVKIYHEGQTKQVVPKEVDYYLFSASSMFSIPTNLVPFLESTQGNRASTGGRMIQQALPLIDREAPLVQSKMGQDSTFEEFAGGFLDPILGEDVDEKGKVIKPTGVVTKVTKDYVFIKQDTDGKIVKRGLYRDFPLNQEGFLNSLPLVEEGDKVKWNTPLADNNYNDNGTLAIGKNLTVAFMPWKGYNFEDGAVITESAAQKLSHSALHKKNLFITPTKTQFDITKFIAWYPGILTADNKSKLDDKGLPKKGAKFAPGELLVAILEERELSEEEKIIRKLSKATMAPFVKKILEWDEEEEGEVIDVRQNGRNIDIYIKSVHPFKEGDKLSGRFGNKSIITKIIADSDAPHRADGTPVDVMLNPHGVPGRMNIGQILETAAGKIAEKTGKAYKVKSFSGDDNAAKIYGEMKKLGIKPNEKLTDGATGKGFEKEIFVGKQYFMKLRHIVKKKAGEHSFGSYDINELPVGKGAQKIDPMLTYSMLAHGTKNLLKEMSTIKGRKNDEYWRNLQLGLAPPPPEGNFVFDKMINYLKAAGVNVEKKGSKFRIFPLTDDKIKEWSAGELTDPGAMLKGKNLAERKGGLFDREITGGLTGEKWTHISLVKKLPNPMYETAITKLLDLTEDKFSKVLTGELEYNGKTGVEAISAGLKAISVPAELRRLRAELKTAPESNVNKLNSKVRYLQALKDLKYTPEQAYMTKLVPVLPPVYRPIYPLPSGDLMVSDVNQHYRDIGVINNNYKAIKSKLSKEEQRQYDHSLYSAIKAQQGFTDPVTYSQKKYKGVIKELTGKQVKHGFVHSTTWGRRQELSARSTITVEPDLGIDEVGIPKNMAKTIFQPFIIKELVRQGMRAGKALQEVNDNSPLAQKALELIVKDRPVLLNRAPSLHKHSIQAFRPVLVDGKAIKLNPIIFSGFNADLDGDTMAVHVPVGPEAVTEAHKILPSNIIFKHGDNSVVPEISQEYIVGLYYLSALGKNTNKTFKSITEAKAAGLHPTDVFKLHGKSMTIGQYEINKVLPAALRDYTRQMNKKAVGGLFEQIGKKYRSDFGKVANRFKELGNTYAHQRSHTISITDFVQDKSYRDKLYAKELPKINAMKGTAKINAYMDLTAKVEKAQDKAMSKKNNIYEMIEAGSIGGGKKGNVRQILSLPGVVQDLDGNPIPVPILKSYGEGIDTAGYWNHIYGVRRGTVDRAVNTADSGALNKALLGITRRLLVTTKDCKTHEGIEISMDSKDVMDRHLSESIKGVAKKNDLVDSRILLKLKAAGVKIVKVRSPLTCKTANGVCQLCYGLMPNGQLPALGENIGVIESQALTERSTQLVMRTFHTGGAASGASGGVTEGFPRLVQLLEVPKKLKNKAILSPVKGKVKSIRKNVVGGYDVRIEGYGTKNDQTITVPSSRNVSVKIGSSVSPGDSLSDGSIKPQELAEYKGHLAAQRYIVDQINDIYGDDFYKKGLETVIRGISDNAEVTEASTSSGFLRGDKTTISQLEKINRDRAKESLDTIKYKPYFKSIETLNVDSEDWLTRFYTNRIKAAIQEGASKAVYGDIAGKDPIPAYIYGDEFGDKK
jgi:DNA-directed RNA polymerase subunit beta'